METRRKVRKKQLKQVHYMSLEFLMGRSLMKNAFIVEVHRLADDVEHVAAVVVGEGEAVARAAPRLVGVAVF